MGLGFESFHGEHEEYKKPSKIEADKGHFSFPKTEEDALRKKLAKSGYADKDIEAIIAKKKAAVEGANKKFVQMEAGNILEKGDKAVRELEEAFQKRAAEDPEFMAAMERRAKKMGEAEEDVN